MLRDVTVNVLGAALIFGFAFLLGSSLMLDKWADDAKRGLFEVGHVVYVAKPLHLTAPCAVLAQDVAGLTACTAAPNK